MLRNRSPFVVLNRPVTRVTPPVEGLCLVLSGGAGCGVVGCSRKGGRMLLGGGLRVSHRVVTAVIVALVVAWLLFAASSLISLWSLQTDFSVFYSAAVTLRDHSGSIYDTSAITATTLRYHSCPLYPNPGYLYPPLLAILLTPLTALSCSSALHVWVALLLGLWIGSAALVVLWLRRLWAPTPLATAIGLTFTLLCWPLASGVTQYAQVDTIVLFFLLLAPWLIASRHPGWGGAALAFVAMIKVFPVVLIGYYVLRGRWRVVWGAALCMVALLVFQIAVVGLPEMLAMRAILSNGSVFVPQADNFSLLHLPVWIALTLGARSVPTANLPGAVLVALATVVYVIVTLAAHPRFQASGTADTASAPDDVAQSDLLGYAWSVCAMLLLTPLVWQHYLAWLLAPLVFCGSFLLAKKTRSRADLALLALLVAGYVLATLKLPFAYDILPQYILGPYVGSYPLRPPLMSLHPVGEVLVWLATGLAFARVTGVVPRRWATHAVAAHVDGQPVEAMASRAALD